MHIAAPASRHSGTGGSGQRSGTHHAVPRLVGDQQGHPGTVSPGGGAHPSDHRRGRRRYTRGRCEGACAVRGACHPDTTTALASHRDAVRQCTGDRLVRPGHALHPGGGAAHWQRHGLSRCPERTQESEPDAGATGPRAHGRAAGGTGERIGARSATATDTGGCTGW